MSTDRSAKTRGKAWMTEVPAEFSSLPELPGTDPCRKCFRYCTILWNESHILNRILYKSKNQLKGWKAFKKTVEIQRYLKRIAVFETWFNSTGLVFFEEVRQFLGYLQTFSKLIEATREAAKSTF